MVTEVTESLQNNNKTTEDKINQAFNDLVSIIGERKTALLGELQTIYIRRVIH
jgi:NADPH-dependent 7-cyano-7-deazaguanine reductase QueF